MTRLYIPQECETGFPASNVEDAVHRVDSCYDVIDVAPSSTFPPSGQVNQQGLGWGLEAQDTAEVSDSSTVQKIPKTQIMHEERPDSVEWPESTEFSNENKLNEARLMELHSKFTRELLNQIRRADFEFGYESSAETFVRGRLGENALATKNWMNDVFLECFADEHITAGILRIIAHLDYEEVEPQGPTMAIAALSHKSPSVKECAVRAFENWERPECIDFLKHVEAGDRWLRDYIEAVISDLEGVAKR